MSETLVCPESVHESTVFLTFIFLFCHRTGTVNQNHIVLFQPVWLIQKLLKLLIVHTHVWNFIILCPQFFFNACWIHLEMWSLCTYSSSQCIAWSGFKNIPYSSSQYPSVSQLDPFNFRNALYEYFKARLETRCCFCPFIRIVPGERFVKTHKYFHYVHIRFVLEYNYKKLSITLKTIQESPPLNVCTFWRILAFICWGWTLKKIDQCQENWIFRLRGNFIEATKNSQILPRELSNLLISIIGCKEAKRRFFCLSLEKKIHLVRLSL